MSGKANECVSYIYKKTDSVLKGNIGPELESILRGTEVSRLSFIPVYPNNNRITKNGRQYINGKHANETCVSRDLFMPVVSSNVSKIIQKQGDVHINIIKIGGNDNSIYQDVIFVYDAATNDELKSIALQLENNNMLQVFAGCEGFEETFSSLIAIKHLSRRAWKVCE